MSHILSKTNNTDKIIAIKTIWAPLYRINFYSNKFTYENFKDVFLSLYSGYSQCHYKVPITVPKNDYAL